MAFARLAFRVLLTLLILLVGIGLLLPSHATVERSIVINADAGTVFPYVNSMRAFHDWSPWSTIDPGTSYAFEGPDQGVGSRMTWQSSQPDVGVGSMEITVSEPTSTVVAELDFGGKGHALTTFELAPGELGGSVLLWRFETTFGWDLFARYIGLMMDGMIGSSYQKGLTTLKQRVEIESSEN